MAVRLDGVESFANMWNLRGAFPSLTKNLLENCFNGVTHLKIAITHNHEDHLNLLDNLLKLIRDNDSFNIPDVHVFYGFKGDASDSVSNAVAFFNNSLGEDVGVVPIRPLQYPIVGGAHKEHQRNLIVRINYGGRSVLLLGDADDALFQQLQHFPEDNFNVGLFSDVDTVIASHHGSNGHNEIAWIDFVIQNSRERTVSCIISSSRFGIDGIPTDGGLNLIQGHVFRARCSSSLMCNENPPVFITDDPLVGGTGLMYYNVHISEFGLLTIENNVNVYEGCILPFFIEYFLLQKDNLIGRIREVYTDHDDEQYFSYLVKLFSYVAHHEEMGGLPIDSIVRESFDGELAEQILNKFPGCGVLLLPGCIW
jgi:hypothetical protein